MSVYATPHRWTPFFQTVRNRRVIEPDQRNWDYKHQVMEVPAVPAWRVFLWVKLIEICLQARPKALYRSYLHRDPDIRHAMRWYTAMGRRVVLRELFEWLRHRRRPGPTVAAYLGADALPEQALSRSTARSARPDRPSALRISETTSQSENHHQPTSASASPSP